MLESDRMKRIKKYAQQDRYIQKKLIEIGEYVMSDENALEFIKILEKCYEQLKKKYRINWVPYPMLRFLIHITWRTTGCDLIDSIIWSLYREYPYKISFAAGDREKTGLGLFGWRDHIHFWLKESFLAP